MAFDSTKLLDDINAGLRLFAEDPEPFPIASELPPIAPASLVRFGVTDVQPPSGLYVAKDEGILVTAHNSLSGVEIRVRGRFLKTNGEIYTYDERFTPGTDRSATRRFYRFPEGFLLNLSLLTSGSSPQRGQTWARAALAKGNVTLFTEESPLIAAYLGTRAHINWPPGKHEHPIEGAGAIRIITVDAPAAGADWSTTVPADTRWKLLAVRARLVSSAAGGNRRVQLLCTDGTNFFHVFNPNQYQPISVGRYYFGNAANFHYDPTAALHFWSLPENIFLPSGFVIESDTIGMDVADQWDATTISVEEWIDV